MNREHGVTDSGFERKRYEDILLNLRRRARQEYGEGINVSDTSPLGMFLNIIAWSFANMWEQYEHSFYQNYLLYAEGFALDMWASNFGEAREFGTKAQGYITITGEPGLRVPRGFKVSVGTELVYKTIQDVVITDNGTVEAEIQAESVGSQYNVTKHTVTQIVNPTLGVFQVINEDNIKGGSDVETDDKLRERLLLKLRTPLTGDNVAQYEAWAKSITGVGAVRVLPITPKPGYVTVILSDVSGNEADDKLISEVEDYIDSVKPTGAGVYVKSADRLSIVVNVDLDIEKGYNQSDIKLNLESEISKYLESIALRQNYVSRAKIGHIIIKQEGVNDYSNLKINNTLDNIELNDTEVPVLSELNIEVI